MQAGGGEVTQLQPLYLRPQLQALGSDGGDIVNDVLLGLQGAWGDVQLPMFTATMYTHVQYFPGALRSDILYLLLDKKFSSEDSENLWKPDQDTQLAENKLQGDWTTRADAIIIIKPASF